MKLIYSVFMGLRYFITNTNNLLINQDITKNYQKILEDYSLYIYPRPGFEITSKHDNIHIIKGVPQLEISATFIRDALKKGQDVSYLMPEKAWKYTEEMNLYR